MFFHAQEPQKVIATAYCDIGWTKSQRYVDHGTLSVDRKYISLGSRLRIIFAPAINDATVVKKFFQDVRRTVFHADDTGGKIIGRRIDVWMLDCRDAKKFGRRPAVIIVEKPGDDSISAKNRYPLPKWLSRKTSKQLNTLGKYS